MGMTARESVSREWRLRAVARSLEDLLAEIDDLGVADLDKLLGAAALAIDDALDKA